MFGAQAYASLVNKLKDGGMVFSVDWHAPFREQYLLMRHDVDFSVTKAHDMARQEVALGVRSTFFFMLSSNMYNLVSQKNRTLVQEIREMGHKVSLHFDPTAYPDLSGFEHERSLFERLFDTEIDIVSIHRPGVFLEDNNTDLSGVSQTYQDRYFKDMTYLSDSAGRDVIPLVDQFLQQSHPNGLHLLTHPIWWGQRKATPTATLDDWQAQTHNFIQSEVRLNCKAYKG